MAQRQKQRPRRDKGSGGLHFKHGRDCPRPIAVVDDKGETHLERPAHKPCVGLWVARVDLGVGGDGKRRTREISARSRADAIRKLRELRAQVDEHGDAPTATMTVEKWLNHWLVEKVALENDPHTLKGYRSAANTWLIPHLGRLRLDRLEAQHVREMYKVMRSPGHGRKGEGLAEGSVLKVHNVLAKALSDAMAETTLRRNVTEHIARPKAARRESSLTADEARRLLASVQTDPLGARIAAALYTASRQGEVLGMQWDRIDLHNGTLDLAWQLQRLGFVHGCRGTCGKKRAGSCPQRQLEVPPGFEHRQLEGGLCLTRPKSEESRRLIPIAAPLLGWLIARAGYQQGQPNPHNLVFTRPDGRPLDPRQDLDAWYAALALAQVPRIDLHSARHTTATLLDIAGTPRDVTQQIMGHSSALTTAGYIHNTDLTKAREALSRLHIEGPAAS